MSPLNPYTAYRPSGVEWIGEVPESWDVLATARVTDLTTGDSDTQDAREDGKYPFFVRSQTVEAIDSYSFDGESVLTSGDGAGVGKIFHHFIGRLEFHQRVYLFHNFKRITGRFFFYFLREHLHRVVLAGNAKSTVDSLRRPMLRMFPLCLPSLPEQQTIVKFLDYETAKIDALIEQQQQLIALLGEKRQAVISHAVTKGLNPDAPMRDSGIEWLGEVPEHWDVSKFGYVSSVVRGGSPRPAGDPTLFDGDYSPWVTVAEVTKDNRMGLTETSSFLTKKGSAQSRLFQAGTLLLSNSGATLGVPKVLMIQANANDGVVGFENLRHNREFCYYYLASLTENLRDRIKQGSGQPNLNTEIVKHIEIPIPPDEETDAIVAHIGEQLKKLTRLVERATDAMELLQERRTALISAAVTGKIDVRRWKPPSNDRQSETETEVA